jgi:hypothetical protein
MWWNLNDVFKEELKEETQPGYDIYGRYQRTPKEGNSGLAKKPKLMITYDPPTNSILVANASSAQLHEIGQLIEDFDKPTPTDLVRARVNATVKIHYSRASIIAAALKEVYVDLLSSNDKEFASAEGRRQTRDTKTLTTIKFGDSTSSNGADPPQVRTSFNGELSIGIDDVSNTLLISCQEELFDGVVNQIRRLDEESAPKMQIVVQEGAQWNGQSVRSSKDIERFGWPNLDGWSPRGPDCLSRRAFRPAQFESRPKQSTARQPGRGRCPPGQIGPLLARLTRNSQFGTHGAAE